MKFVRRRPVRMAPLGAVFANLLLAHIAGIAAAGTYDLGEDPSETSVVAEEESHLTPDSDELNAERRRDIEATGLEPELPLQLVQVDALRNVAGQEAQAVEPKRRPQVEEIVVTATRRETTLQETPVAVTAITGDRIEQSRIQSIEDTLMLVPNASFINSKGSAASYASIRGSLTIDESPGIDLPVIYFIDELFYGSGASAYPDFYDIRQVEVLRGPQGTTFGRNVTGGAIVIRSNEPTEHFSAALSGTVGNEDRYEVRGHASGPIAGDVLGRVAFSMRDYPGFQTNLYNGNTEGGQKFGSVRTMLSAPLGDRTNVLLNANYTRDTSNGVGSTFFVFGNGPSAPRFTLENTQFPNDPATTNGNVSPKSDNRAYSVIARIEHDLDFAKLTSITGYRNLDGSYLNDSDASPIDIQQQVNAPEESQWSQELRLTSDIGSLEWIAGLYYLRQEADLVNSFNIDAVPGTTLFLLIPYSLDAVLTQGVRTTSIAPYIEGVYHFTDWLGLRAGVRYTWDEKSGTTDHRGVNIITTFPTEYNVSYSESWRALTPRVIVELKPADGLFLYGGASRGFKSGGFSLNPTTADAASTPYMPEYVWNYEAGIRSTFLDQRITANLTAFRQETEDLQVRIFDGTTFIFENAASTVAQGVELELAARPSQYVTAGLSYGWIDATYESFDNCDRGLTGSGASCSGKRFAGVPEQSGAAFLDTTWDIGAAGTVFGRLEGQYRSKVEFTALNDNMPREIYDRSDFATLNAQIGWYDREELWKATLWGKNLTDEHYVNIAYDLSVYFLDTLITESNEQVWLAKQSQGRSFGFTLTRHFR